MNYKEITEKRRAINFFDPDRNVTDDLLGEMIDLAARAPSSFNFQPWNLMVLRDVDAKEKLKALAWDQPKVVEAPVTLPV
jgi:nitroreductase